MPFAMNFECKRTCKWKRFCSQTSLYHIGLVGHPFFKCDEMRLRWVFTVKTAVTLLKSIFEFMFIEVTLAEVLKKIFSKFLQRVSRVQVVTIRPVA